MPILPQLALGAIVRYLARYARNSYRRSHLEERPYIQANTMPLLLASILKAIGRTGYQVEELMKAVMDLSGAHTGGDGRK